MSEDELTSLSYLNEIGLKTPLDARTADQIVAELLVVHGRVAQGFYKDAAEWDHFYDAYHTIAKHIVREDSPDDLIENTIPESVYGFAKKNRWYTFSYEIVRRYLQGPIFEWKGKRLLLKLSRSHSSIPDMNSLSTTEYRDELIGEHLEQLRAECRLTIEQLAGRVELSTSTVFRHLKGNVKPRLAHIAAYEALFSELLQRKVIIEETPTKRP